MAKKETKMTMKMRRLLDKLAELKNQAKMIKDEVDTVQEKILDLPGHPTEYKHSEYGTLKLSERTNWAPISNLKLLEREVLEEEDIIELAKISAAALKKQIGTNLFEELVDDGVIKQKSPSIFYTLK